MNITSVEVAFAKNDLRPAFVFADVKGAELHRVKAQRASGVPTFSLADVERFAVSHSWPIPDTRLDRVDKKTF